MDSRTPWHSVLLQKLKSWYMIYLLTAIGLSPGGSSTVHIYTHTIYRTIQNKQYIEQHNNFWRVRENSEEKHGKTSDRVAASNSHKILHILWNPEVYYCIHMSLPLVPFLSQIKHQRKGGLEIRQICMHTNMWTFIYLNHNTHYIYWS